MPCEILAPGTVGPIEEQAEDGDAKIVSIRAADPTGVDMDRVASAMRAADDFDAGRLAPSAVRAAVGLSSQRPPEPTWLFASAAAAGAAALAVLFGVRHLAAVGLIVVSAAIGAVLRRVIGHYSTNALLQPLCAALLAGIIGALAVRYQLSSSLRLVAVCPCMILVPGPHVLNGECSPGAFGGNDRRRHDRRHDHLGDELRRHRPQNRHR